MCFNRRARDRLQLYDVYALRDPDGEEFDAGSLCEVSLDLRHILLAVRDAVCDQDGDLSHAWARAVGGGKHIRSA